MNRTCVARWRAMTALSLWCLAAGCTMIACSARPAGGPDRTLDRVPEFEQSQQRHEQVLQEMAATTSECGAVCHHVSAICDLSDKICRIAKDNPAHLPASAACKRGKDRCNRAREQTRPLCRCVDDL